MNNIVSRFALIIAFMWLPMPLTSGATVLLLKEGGVLEGELLNPNETNRKLYRIKTAEGLEISLDPRLVDRVQGRERDALIEYNREAPLTDNTIETHLHWARWCSERQLPIQARIHWQQVLELDPDHKEARQVLGYVNTPAGWVFQQDRLESRGFVLDRGQWKTPYEIEVANMHENRRKNAASWQQTVRNLYRRLPNQQAEAELLAIRNPDAYIALREVLLDALARNNPYNRMILLRTLVQLHDSRALQFVAGWSVRPDEPMEEIRKMCVEELQKRINEQPEIRQIMVNTYRNTLVNPRVDLAIIHLTARTLGEIGGHEAVPELIEALVFRTTETIQPQSPSYNFGSGGTGYSQPGRPVTRRVEIPNQTVLSALRRLTGMDFGFDQPAWRNWHRASLRSPSLNLRRE
jgi:hypothetical protein